MCVILQERTAILGRRARRPDTPQIGVDSIFRHVQAEFEEFAADPLGTPGRILGGHLFNQVDQILVEARTTRWA